MDNTLQQHAESTIAKGSKSFAAAARLFGPQIRWDVMLLYTWCRYCDDLTDGQQLGRGTLRTASTSALARLRADSLAALAGAPTVEQPYRALAEVCRRHPITTELIQAHVRGFELDAAGWQPESLDDTLQYSYHVAGSVGIMMALMMGVRDQQTLCRACDLGIAFQLTNIARDVVEDAIAGRSYLPVEWLGRAGLDIEDLAKASCRDGIYPLVCRLVEAAEPYYASAAIGVQALPRRAAWAIATARSLYRDIGRKIVRNGAAAFGDRVYTGAGRKAWRVATAMPAALTPRRAGHAAGPRAGLWTPPGTALAMSA